MNVIRCFCLVFICVFASALTQGCGSGTSAGSVDNRSSYSAKQTVNVENFGAVPNDGIDDTEAFQSAFNEGSLIYIPAGTYLVSSTINLPVHAVVVVGEGMYNTVIEYLGDGFAFHDKNDSRKIGSLWSDLSIVKGADNANKGVGAVYLMGVQDSQFNRIRIQYFDGYGIVLDAANQGSWWNSFNSCRIWPEDVEGAAAVKLTTTGKSAVNAISFNDCNFHEQSNVPSNARADGVVSDHMAHSIHFNNCWFERLNFAAIVGGFDWTFDSCRFEKINDDTGKVIMVNTALRKNQKVSGLGLRIEGCTNSVGSMVVVDENGNEYIPDGTVLPPYSTATVKISNYGRHNGDGKDGIVEDISGIDFELPVDLNELQRFSDVSLVFVATLRNASVSGDGRVSAKIVGRNNTNTFVKIGQDDYGDSIYSFGSVIPVGTSTVMIISPPMPLAHLAPDLARLALRITEPPPGVLASLSGNVELSAHFFYGDMTIVR